MRLAVALPLALALALAAGSADAARPGKPGKAAAIGRGLKRAAVAGALVCLTACGPTDGRTPTPQPGPAPSPPTGTTTTTAPQASALILRF